MRLATGISLLIILSLASPANAADFSACWVVSEFDYWSGQPQQITRCRIAGGGIVDYASDSSVPGRLFPLPGTDLAGLCWYYSSTDGNWLFAQLYSNGDAILGYTVSNLGGFAVLTGRIPRCTSEPTTTSNPVAEIWSYVTQYIHPPPLPDLNPDQGDGVTGLATYIGLPIPDPHAARLAGPAGEALDVQIRVSSVTIDWGDGVSDTYPATASAMAGYPTGIASHIYETKSDAIAISVSYNWTARWRVNGGAWSAIAVPATTTGIGYPVSEIISVITG